MTLEQTLHTTRVNNIKPKPQDAPCEACINPFTGKDLLPVTQRDSLNEQINQIAECESVIFDYRYTAERRESVKDDLRWYMNRQGIRRIKNKQGHEMYVFSPNMLGACPHCAKKKPAPAPVAAMAGMGYDNRMSR